MNEFKKLLNFIEFTHKFQQVKRIIYATSEDRDENDAEHSFQLALVSWYLNRVNGLGFNEEKLIKYALAHDLVEVYAGDTYFYTEDKKERESKPLRERKALVKIKKQFQKFEDLAEIIEGYEEKWDEEARFVYALDKILPPINVYLDNGRSWKRDRVTYEMIRTKDEKVKVSPEIERIWKQVVKILDKKKHLFGKRV